MEKEKIDKQGRRLKFRYLTTDDLDQFNDLLRYSFQVTNKILINLGYNVDEIRQAKSPILEKAKVFGWFDGEKLASQVAIYPMKVNVHGLLLPMGGITGVSTYPEYSRQGLVSDLMLHAMEEMKKAGQTISFLYPYSVPFYRKKGWEIVCDRMSFSIKDTQLPSPVPILGRVDRVDIDHPDYLAVHNTFTQSHHGALERSELEWEEYWRWESDDTVVALYYNGQEEAKGYIVYSLESDKLKIKEMVYLTEEARHGLWNYISAHFSMVTEVKGFNYTGQSIAFELEDTAIEETLKTYFMARIVDVEAFILKYPFKNPPKGKRLHLIIEDPMVEWNRGSFLIFWDKEGKTHCERKESDERALKMSIGTLTTLLMSYRLAGYLHKICLIEGDKDLADWLGDLIEDDKVYFSDYF